MPVTAVVGLQWGDEGKGKLTDALCPGAHCVVRCQGGSNAGHTIVVGDVTYKLRIMPSGIVQDGPLAVVGSGVVVDPDVLLQEMDTLRASGIDVERVRLSQRAHVILPHHRALDGAAEDAKGANAIGTTRQGIGPAYVDRANRTGIRVEDLLNLDRLRERLEPALKLANHTLTTYYHSDPVSLDDVVTAASAWGKALAPYITDTEQLIHASLGRGERVVLEGAQGALLDVDHGSYPYVTSSSTVTGGLLAGAGVGPSSVDSVVGIAKAYTTRVGGGPFPSEVDGVAHDHLATRGHEFGTVTGRPRRCGWLDIAALRHATQLTGATSIVLTKLDVLSGLSSIPLFEPKEGSENLTPLAGWDDDLTRVAHYADLPRQARDYVETVRSLVGIPISHVSVGPERTQLLTVS